MTATKVDYYCKYVDKLRQISGLVLETNTILWHDDVRDIVLRILARIFRAARPAERAGYVCVCGSYGVRDKHFECSRWQVDAIR